MMKKGRVYDLEDRLITFAVGVCKLAERLPKSRVGDPVAGQIIRPATSSAANYGEAQGAESKRDFIHKMRICLKELRETHVWLVFIQRMELIPHRDLHHLLDEANQLLAIFQTRIKTAQAKRRT